MNENYIISIIGTDNDSTTVLSRLFSESFFEKYDYIVIDCPAILDLLVSNILNHMYPRTFPGNYKAGIYSLYFLSGGGKGIDMQSETSEFCMVKDESRSKTGIIEMEHNFFYPYQTFCIYTLRIYRVLAGAISSCFDRVFPSEYRFLLTNDFYDYVTSKNREKIATMTGNDDMLKFSTIW